MFSGLERQRTAANREKSVAWAWVKARGTLGRSGLKRPSSKLTENILTPAVSDLQKVENWRDRLVTVAYRKLAHQLCEQFYNFSIFQPWRSRPAEAVATSRMLKRMSTHRRQSALMAMWCSKWQNQMSLSSHP